MKRNILFSSIFALLSLIGVGYGIWGMTLERIGSAMIKGWAMSLEIIGIIFGVLLLFEIAKKKKWIQFFEYTFKKISPDKRVQLLFVSWAFICFIEGIAGFGTPLIFVVPILIFLRFNPIFSIIAALLGDSIAVAFGAFGVPVTIGIASIVSPGQEYALEEITKMISRFSILGYITIPLILLFLYGKFHNKKQKDFLEMIPFSFFVSGIMGISMVGTAYYIGPEFPSIIAGACGMGTILICVKTGFCLPKNKHTKSKPHDSITRIPKKVNIFLLLSISFLYLVVSRIPFLPVKDFFMKMGSVSVDSVWGYSVGQTFYPFYSIGTIILFVSLCAIFFLKVSKKEKVSIMKDTMRKGWKIFLSIGILLAFSQVFLLSGENIHNNSSMPILLADSIRAASGEYWILIAPWIGAFGAFIAGSATVSNLIFSGFQYETSHVLAISPIIILSLQGIGAAVGNMIAISNVMMGIAVAKNKKNNEGKIIKKNAYILAGFLICFGIWGFIMHKLI